MPPPPNATAQMTLSEVMQDPPAQVPLASTNQHIQVKKHHKQWLAEVTVRLLTLKVLLHFRVEEGGQIST